MQKYDGNNSDNWLYSNSKDIMEQQGYKNFETGGEYQAKVTGDQGELVLSSVLKSLPDCYHVMNNILIKTNTNIGSTQIDHVIVSPFGIFVVETKNHKGMIFGDMLGKVWTQVLNTGHFTFYSPVLQNEGHLNQLSKAIKVSRAYMTGVIVFTNSSAKLQNVQCPFCFTVEEVYGAITGYANQIFNDEQVWAIIRRIDKVNSSSYENDMKHVDSIKDFKNRFKNW